VRVTIAEQLYTIDPIWRHELGQNLNTGSRNTCKGKWIRIAISLIASRASAMEVKGLGWVVTLNFLDLKKLGPKVQFYTQME